MNETTNTLFAEEEDTGKRLDKFLAEKFPDYSRTYFQNLIEKELVLLNGEVVKKRMPLKAGDEIEVEFTLSPEINLTPEKIPLEILYEDDFLLAINKPPGMVVHPAAGCYSGTFVHALLYHCRIEQKEGDLRPGIVHRLDKDTSGVLLAAKTELAQRRLVEQFSSRKIEKTYLAICVGKPKVKVIEGNIGRNPYKRQEMAIVREKGKEAITEILSITSRGDLSLVTLKPLTGRTHQLRVHLQSIGCPILGDPTYGNPFFNQKYRIGRQLLHAESLRFSHPISQTLLEIKAKVPDDMDVFVQKIQAK